MEKTVNYEISVSSILCTRVKYNNYALHREESFPDVCGFIGVFIYLISKSIILRF